MFGLFSVELIEEKGQDVVQHDLLVQGYLKLDLVCHDRRSCEQRAIVTVGIDVARTCIASPRIGRLRL